MAGTRLRHPRHRRGGHLPVADPAGALDGQRRVRHLRLCLDLAADDRRHHPSRLAAHRAAHHSRNTPSATTSTGLRGFLLGSRWIVFAAATMVAVLGALAVHGSSLARARHHHAALPRLHRAAALPGEQHARRAGALLQRRQYRAAAAVRAAPAHADRGHGRGASAPASPPTPRPRWPRSPSPPGRRRSFSSSCSNRCLARKIPGRAAALRCQRMDQDGEPDLRGLGLLYAADLHRRAGAAPVPAAGRGRALLRRRENPRAGDVHPLLGVGRGRAPVRGPSCRRRRRGAGRARRQHGALDVLAVAADDRG